MKKYRKKRKSNETEKKNEKMTRSTRRETGWEKRKCPAILRIQPSISHSGLDKISKSYCRVDLKR